MIELIEGTNCPNDGTGRCDETWLWPDQCARHLGHKLEDE